jgi:hypothetical protein
MSHMSGLIKTILSLKGFVSVYVQVLAAPGGYGHLNLLSALLPTSRGGSSTRTHGGYMSFASSQLRSWYVQVRVIV